jgi:anti-sigma B factor antagonist
VNVTRHADGDDLVLRVAGELDLATAGALGEQVALALADRPAELVVDLAEVTFCDSSGIEALLNARATTNRHNAGFRAINARGITRRSMQVTGVLDLLAATTGA